MKTSMLASSCPDSSHRQGAAQSNSAAQREAEWGLCPTCPSGSWLPWHPWHGENHRAQAPGPTRPSGRRWEGPAEREGLSPLICRFPLGFLWTLRNLLATLATAQPHPLGDSQSNQGGDGVAPSKAPERLLRASVPTSARCFSEPTTLWHLRCAGHFVNTATFTLEAALLTPFIGGVTEVAG